MYVLLCFLFLGAGGLCNHWQIFFSSFEKIEMSTNDLLVYLQLASIDQVLSLLEKLCHSVRDIILSTRDECLCAQKNADLHKVKDKKEGKRNFKKKRHSRSFLCKRPLPCLWKANVSTSLQNPNNHKYPFLTVFYFVWDLYGFRRARPNEHYWHPTP